MSMPTAEIILLGAIALVVISLFAILRRERRSQATGQASQIHPFRLGLYRGCAVAVILFVTYGAVMLLINLFSGPPAP
jgi:uncharacterized membrane protein YtjA (UPF0391 family)